MPFQRFLAFDAIGSLVWAGSFILIGYASGVNLESLQAGLRVVSTTAQGLIIAALAAWGISKLVSQRRTRRVEAEA
jgi:membrane protein DedA with SNARE-associated domain